jgi:ribonuclease HI
MDGPERRTTEDADLNEVRSLELRLLDPEVRRDGTAVARLLHPGFVELGASGVVWNAASVLQALADEPGEPTDVSDLRACRLSEDVVLVTYRAQTPRRTSLRASVWVRDPRGWRVRFHQGTPSPE